MKKIFEAQKIHVVGLGVLFLSFLTGCGLLDHLNSTSSSNPTQSSGSQVVLVGNANFSDLVESDGSTRFISKLIHSTDGSLSTGFVADSTGAKFVPGSGINDIKVFQNKAYVVNSSAGTLQVVDLLTGGITEVSLGAPNDPLTCLVVSAHEVYVSYYLADQVAKIDPTAASPVLAVLDMPGGSFRSPYDSAHPGFARPSGMCKVGNTLYVALNNIHYGEAGFTFDYSPAGPGLVQQINLTTFALSTLTAGTGKNMATAYYNTAFNSDRVFFINSGNYANDGVIDVFSVSSGTIVASLAIGGGPSALLIDSSGKGYVKDDLNNQVHTISSVGLTFSGYSNTYSISTGYVGGMMLDENGYVYVGSSSHPDYSADNLVYVFNSATDALVQTMNVGYNPSPMALWVAE